MAPCKPKDTFSCWMMAAQTGFTIIPAAGCAGIVMAPCDSGTRTIIRCSTRTLVHRPSIQFPLGQAQVLCNTCQWETDTNGLRNSLVPDACRIPHGTAGRTPRWSRGMPRLQQGQPRPALLTCGRPGRSCLRRAIGSCPIYRCIMK